MENKETQVLTTSGAANHMYQQFRIDQKRSELVLRFAMQLASSVAINYVIEEDKFECKTINIYNLRHLFDVAEALADEAIKRGHVI